MWFQPLFDSTEIWELTCAWEQALCDQRGPTAGGHLLAGWADSTTAISVQFDDCDPTIVRIWDGGTITAVLADESDIRRLRTMAYQAQRLAVQRDQLGWLRFHGTRTIDRDHITRCVIIRPIAARREPQPS